MAVSLYKGPVIIYQRRRGWGLRIRWENGILDIFVSYVLLKSLKGEGRGGEGRTCLKQRSKIYKQCIEKRSIIYFWDPGIKVLRQCNSNWTINMSAILPALQDERNNLYTVQTIVWDDLLHWPQQARDIVTLLHIKTSQVKPTWQNAL